MLYLVKGPQNCRHVFGKGRQTNLCLPLGEYIKVHLQVCCENGLHDEEPHSLQFGFIEVEKKVVLWHCIK